MLSRISETRLHEELKINERLFELFDTRESLVFEAGAGSGKTYSLVECLRHIVRVEGVTLRTRGQKVACITYTNVAAEEVRERLGTSDVTVVSTIHDFLWPRMAPFQADLVSIHRERLSSEMARINKDLLTDKKFAEYAKLSETERELFSKAITEARGMFYDAYDLKAPDFREAMGPALGNLSFASSLTKNVSKFKSLATNCIRKSNYESCIASIDDEDEGFTQVEYDPRTSRDRLARMTFSHDTLLSYSLQLTEKSPVFRKMLLDAYPFVLVDECQDTSEDVVKLLERLREESRRLGRDFVVGYFGDPAQSIYDKGIANRLHSQAIGLAVVTKPHNRRSCREVIQAGNRIRGGGIVQKSIFEDDKGGTVELFAPRGRDRLSDDAIRSFISRTALELGATERNPLHCLVLKNQRVAELLGFGRLFEQMRKTPYFKRGLGFEKIGEEFATTHPDKLNRACRLLFDLCLMRRKLADGSTILGDVGIGFGSSATSFTIRTVRRTVEYFRAIDANTPGEYLEGIEQITKKADDDGLASCARKIVVGSVGSEALGLSPATGLLIRELHPHASATEATNNSAEVEGLLCIDFSEYDAWCDYVRDDESGTVRYHTYHGTKGEEYDSVLIIGENDFISRDARFKTFFETYGTSVEDEKTQDKVIGARNLLYVATTRAVKNLRVLYVDDISPFTRGIEDVYGPARAVDAITGKVI